jgi:hypothetical protein
MDQDIAVTSGGLCLRHRAGYPIGHIGHQRVLGDRRPGRPMTGHKDWDAVVVVTTPVIDLFHSIATGEDSAGHFDFV